MSDPEKDPESRAEQPSHVADAERSVADAERSTADADARVADQDRREAAQDSREAAQDRREAAQDAREAAQDSRESDQDGREGDQDLAGEPRDATVSEHEDERRADAAARLPAVHQRPWAVGVYLGFTALVGLAWAAPLAATFATTTGEYPRGDAELFDPGAVMLLEALRRMIPAFPAIRVAWLLVAIVAVPLGFAALGFAIAQLAIPGKARPLWALTRAVRTLPTLVVVALVTLLADVVVVLVLTIAGGAIARAVWPAPPSRDIARLAVFALVALAITAISGLHDLASVAAVTGPSRTYISVRAALHVAWRTPGRAAWAYAWRLVAGVGALVLAAAVGLAIGERTAGAIAASALVHQLGLAAAGWSRLSWLSACGRLVRPVVIALARGSGRGASAPPATEVVSADPAPAIDPPASGHTSANPDLAFPVDAASSGAAVDAVALASGGDPPAVGASAAGAPGRGGARVPVSPGDQGEAPPGSASSETDDEPLA